MKKLTVTALYAWLTLPLCAMADINSHWEKAQRYLMLSGTAHVMEHSIEVQHQTTDAKINGVPLVITGSGDGRKRSNLPIA